MLPRKVHTLRVCWLLTALAALAVPALADPVTINFGSAEFQSGNAIATVPMDGSYTGTYALPGGLMLTVMATNSNGGEVHFHETSDDGLGVYSKLSYEPDEIEGTENLMLTFSQQIYLHDFDLRDFFYENFQGGDWYNEIGYYQTDGGGWVQLNAPNTNLPAWHPQNPTNGEHHVVINDYVTKISFTADGTNFVEDNLGNQQQQGHEFALYQIRYSVPEPGSLFLLGTGFLGLAVLRSKRLF